MNIYDFGYSIQRKRQLTAFSLPLFGNNDMLSAMLRIELISHDVLLTKDKGRLIGIRVNEKEKFIHTGMKIKGIEKYRKESR